MPEDADARQLNAEVRQDLRSLSKDTADLVARHLVVAGRLVDEDPVQALTHARAAGALAGRVAVVREALGLTAYAAQEWSEALSELRAARRISGRAEHIAVMADCERALGRPERALQALADPDVPKLEQATRVELVIVVAGARRDLQQHDAAVLLLQGPARATTARRPWAARLWYAYADALLGAGREGESREWFARAAEHDGQGETDALDRLLTLDGVVFEDTQHSDDLEQLERDEEPPAVDVATLLGTTLRVAPGAAGASVASVPPVGQDPPASDAAPVGTRPSSDTSDPGPPSGGARTGAGSGSTGPGGRGQPGAAPPWSG